MHDMVSRQRRERFANSLYKKLCKSGGPHRSLSFLTFGAKRL